MYSVPIGTEFIPPKLTATDLENSKIDVVVINNVDCNKIGEYSVIYEATNKYGTSRYEIKVNVYDSVPKPTINVLGTIPKTIYVDEVFKIPNALAYDFFGNQLEVIKSEESITFSVPTKYIIQYYTEDDYGNNILLQYEIEIIEKENQTIPNLGAYYKATSNLVGERLKDELYNILSKRKIQSYGTAREVLEKSDLGVSTNKVYLIYSSTFVKAKWDGSTYNREHVWPKSLLGVSSKEISNGYRGIASDLHNLRACNNNINSSRGNIVFAKGKGNHGKVSGGYYPGDEHIGDVARIILYMHVAWNYKINVGDLDMFLRWHTEDPVDEFEIKRNEVIYKYQENRNPFIDHPEFAGLIWGNK